MDKSELTKIAKALVASGKGILAADQSPNSAKKLLDMAQVASTSGNRRIFRFIVFSTPDASRFISGVILHDETFNQKTNEGIPIPKYISQQGMIPGIKVDKGKFPLANFPGDFVTEGLDGLRERLIDYAKRGAKFAKWRAVYSIGKGTPSVTAMYTNAESLARYAALCQEEGLVPIVEPEVLMKGNHSIEKSAEVSLKVLKEVFIALERHKVDYQAMLLKPSWIHPGFDSDEKPVSEEVAKVTLEVFKKVLPDGLPGVVFLSGGDSPENSTDHLDKLNEIGNGPWQLSFSFGRALLEPAAIAWEGKKENIERAQRAFYERANLDSLARSGDY